MENTDLTQAALSTTANKDSLSPEVWDKKDDDYKMKSDIQKRLMEIANDFYGFLGVDIPLLDVTLTGSLSNYNYSKYSDFDLHLIVNYDYIETREKSIYQQGFIQL